MGATMPGAGWTGRCFKPTLAWTLGAGISGRVGLSLHTAPVLTFQLSPMHVGQQSPGVGGPELDTFSSLWEYFWGRWLLGC